MGEEQKPRDILRSGKERQRLSPFTVFVFYNSQPTAHPLSNRREESLRQTSFGGDGKEKRYSVASIGEGRMSQLQAKKALESYRRAALLNPKKAWYRIQLGRAYWALGMVEEAIKEIAKACELSPRDPLFRLELAEIHLATNRFDEAVQQLKIACQWAPDDPFYQVRLAAAYLLVRRFRDALDALREAVRLCPWNASYHYLLSQVYQKLGEGEKAAFHNRFRWRLDEYDRHFLKRFHKAIKGALDEN
ncbi:MAG: tetratricopeptide repeat protein [Armatimonadetes bacterium]|nr:tetratricopeptide repeat protein [Armatimonadota bacterium]MDW8122564.1 tetratricopeptide repeat protein [Armatimonadota bacterium]